MSDYDRGRWDVFNLITSVWYGKQCYFLQDKNDIVYSRNSGKYMTLENAILEFVEEIII